VALSSVEAVPQPLRAFRRQQQLEDEAKIAKIVGETEPTDAAGVTAGGDPTRLRGLPVVVRGSSGAVPGTSPLGALLAKER
jgi:hypothetical protein